jgi:hypothetical protein
MANNRILGNPISLDDVRNNAPSVFAQKPADFVSPNYKFVPTINVIETMMANGWQPIAAKQQRTKNPDAREITRHKVVMRMMAAGCNDAALGGLYPTITLVNSHNWSSRMEVIFGMLRLLCSNGLAVLGAEFANLSVRHDKIGEDIRIIMESFVANAGKMLDEARAWDSISLNHGIALAFAREASIIRFGDSATVDHALALLLARRAYDDLPTLWNVYNRVQENAIKGGVRQGSMKRRIRSVNAIQAENSINAELYKLASDYYRMSKIIVE